MKLTKEQKEKLTKELEKRCLSGHYVERMENMIYLMEAYGFDVKREGTTLKAVQTINYNWDCLVEGTYETYKFISGMLEHTLKFQGRLSKHQMDRLHYAFLSPSYTKPLPENMTVIQLSDG